MPADGALDGAGGTAVVARMDDSGGEQRGDLRDRGADGAVGFHPCQSFLSRHLRLQHCEMAAWGALAAGGRESIQQRAPQLDEELHCCATWND